jgi:hypothetical protein
MIATVLAIAMVSMSVTNVLQADPPVSSKNVITLTFDQALSDPGLVAAMNQQLSDEFLINDFPVYTVEVNYMAYVIRISGSYGEWKWFFQRKWKLVTGNNVTN